MPPKRRKTKKVKRRKVGDKKVEALKKKLLTARLKLKKAKLKKNKIIKQRTSIVNKNEVIVNNIYRKTATRRQKRKLNKEDKLETQARNNPTRSVLSQLESVSSQNTRNMLTNGFRDQQLTIKNRLDELKLLQDQTKANPPVAQQQIDMLEGQKQLLQQQLEQATAQLQHIAEVAPKILGKKDEQIQAQTERAEDMEDEARRQQEALIREQDRAEEIERRRQREAEEAEKTLREAEEEAERKAVEAGVKGKQEAEERAKQELERAKEELEERKRQAEGIANRRKVRKSELEGQINVGTITDIKDDLSKGNVHNIKQSQINTLVQAKLLEKKADGSFKFGTKGKKTGQKKGLITKLINFVLLNEGLRKPPAFARKEGAGEGGAGGASE